MPKINNISSNIATLLNNSFIIADEEIQEGFCEWEPKPGHTITMFGLVVDFITKSQGELNLWSKPEGVERAYCIEGHCDLSTAFKASVEYDFEIDTKLLEA